MKRRRALALSVGMVMPGAYLKRATDISPVPLTAATVSDIDLMGFDAPSEIRPGEPYEVLAELANNGDQSEGVEVRYVFEAQNSTDTNFKANTIQSKEADIAAGETITVTFTLEEAFVQELIDSYEPGTYKHGIEVPGHFMRTVDVTIPDTSMATDTPSSSDAAADQAASELDQAAAAIDRAEQQLSDAKTAIERASEGGAAVGDLNERIEQLQAELDGAIERYREAQAAYDNGNYEKSIEASREVIKTAEVVVDDAGAVEDEAQSLSDGTTADVDSAGREDGRRRGFFSNSGDEPDFLSNIFNLTVLGFLLSVVGIFHQMLGGN